MSQLAEIPSGTRRSETLEKLLEGVNETVTLEDFWKSVIQLFSMAVPLQSCSMMYAIEDTNKLVARHFAGGCHSSRQAISNLAIAGSHLERHPQVKIYTFSDIVAEDPSAAERAAEQKGALSEEWLEFVHLAFWNGAKPDAVFSIRRSRAQGFFTKAELQLLLSLHPVLNAGLRRMRALGTLEEQRHALVRFFNRCAISVMFLDSSMQPLFTTNEAMEACGIWNFGEATARRQQPRKIFKVPDDIVAACRSLLKAPHDDEVRRTAEEVTVTHAKAGDLVARVRIERPARQGWTQPTFSVKFSTKCKVDGIRFPEARQALDIMQRLSVNERRVAILVCEGHSNSAIAQQLGKSPRTVECQLTAIFHKLQVNNRVQLARLLSNAAFSERSNGDSGLGSEEGRRMPHEAA